MPERSNETPGVGWVDLKSDCERWVDIVPLNTHHANGDLGCWCKPTFDFVAAPDRKTPVVLIKHNLPPHSFVSGDMKAESIAQNDEIIGRPSYEGESEAAANDPDTCICELCGAIEGHSDTHEHCSGPDFVALPFFDWGDTESEKQA